MERRVHTSYYFIWFIIGLLIGGAAGFILRAIFFTTVLPAGGCPELVLNRTLRKLWADHLIWDKQNIIDSLTDSPAKEHSLKRLLKNQEDIGSAFAKFYGNEAGTILTQLLKGHILIGTHVVAAAKAHDDAALKRADKKWHDNALEIATFLHKANPQNGPLDVMTKMMNDHLALLTKQVMARLENKWEEDIKGFDESFDQIMTMADELTEGIYNKFIAKK